MRLPFTKPGSTRAPAPPKAPRLGNALAAMPQHLGGGRMWHPQPGVVTNLNGRLLHPDTVAERARRGLPPYREPIIGEADPAANDSGGGY